MQANTAKQWFQTSSSDPTSNNTFTVHLDTVPDYDPKPEPPWDKLEGVDVIGGYSPNPNDTRTVKNNRIQVSARQGKYFNIVGGISLKGVTSGNQVELVGTAWSVHGGYSVDNDSSNNTVIIRNGTVDQTVSGGEGRTGKGNTVKVIDSTVHNVFGFSSERIYDVTGQYEGNEDKAANNTVFLQGKVTAGSVLGSYGRIYTISPYGQKILEYNAFDKGNSINVNGTVRLYVLNGFDNLNITLNSDNQNTASITYQDSLKTNTGEDKDILKNGRSLQNRKLNISFEPGLTCCGNYKILAKADDVKVKILMGNAEVNLQDSLIKRTWKFDENATVDYLNLENGLLNGMSANTTSTTFESKILGESLLATMAFVNQGAEFIADDGLRAITAAADPGKATTFGAVHGGTSRYMTGSHVDLNGGGLVVGIASQANDVTFAGFIESGWASSDSHVAGTSADGDHDYYGLGGSLRLDATDKLHIDGSARLGWAKTKFKGVIGSTSTNYDSTSLYITAHVGAGYFIPLTQTTKTELYGRYVYSILHGDDTSVAGYDYTTKAVHTNSIRTGVRLLGDPNPSFSWRLGLAYEHVFAGDAHSQLNCGTAILLDAPSLEGDAGILEIGTTLKPSAESPWSYDFGVKGYAGDRRGVTGHVNVLYSF